MNGPCRIKSQVCSDLQVRAVVLCDVGTVALTEHRDLLLDVLDLVLRLLQVDRLDGNNALSAIVDTFKHLQDKCGTKM